MMLKDKDKKMMTKRGRFNASDSIKLATNVEHTGISVIKKISLRIC